MTCSKCKKSFTTKAGKTIHERYCDGTGTKRDKKKKGKEWRCPKCDKYVHSKKERHVEICDGLGAGAHRRRAKAKSAEAGRAGRDWAKGTAKPRPPKGQHGGYRCGSGRCKGQWYESICAGKVYLDSSYEYRLALYLDTNGVKWEKNTKKFPYIDETGKNRNYIPDFYLPDLDLWIETKGYQTKRDECKWRDFPHEMQILFERDIISLEQGKTSFGAMAESGLSHRS